MTTNTAASRSTTSLRLDLGKLLAISAAAFRQRMNERVQLLGRFGFYFVILLVFSRLWEAVLDGGLETTASDAAGHVDAAVPALGGTTSSYLWYLVITEWIMLSLPHTHLEIERDVRSGDIAYQMCRPVSYVGSKLAEAGGDLALRMLSLGAFGVVLGRILTGTFPNALGLMVAAGLGVLAAMLTVLSYTAIGLSAFWLQDCSPIYWVWQKLCFVLGGLMLPLHIYPGWLQQIALMSPFSAILYGPASLALNPNLEPAIAVLFKLCGWMLIAGAVVSVIYRRGCRVVRINGG